MGSRKPLIAGNWKMFGRSADLAEIGALAETIGPAATKIEVLICPPAVFVAPAAWQTRDKPILIGGQDCSSNAGDAARTGEISAAMLADVGAKYVIVGHSERRQNHKEGDELVRRKAEAAIAAGVTPIVCVGETLAERSAGQVAEVVRRQVAGSTPAQGGAFVVAYEPVWAIGGTSTPTLAEVGEVHALIRETLAGQFGAQANETRILYGGSVGPKNAGEIFTVEGVDGALVGRASLKASDFS
ncbi:MAG: triose-phosphate isomerase, partial [Alphaproteobacteria bacterium]|nr:triose-phosphate isomerase [Alphaproteobacteria bacterium]